MRSMSAVQLYPIILGHFFSPHQKPLVLPLVVGQNTYILSKHFVTSLNTGQIYSFPTFARFLTTHFLPLPASNRNQLYMYVYVYMRVLYISLTLFLLKYPPLQQCRFLPLILGTIPSPSSTAMDASNKYQFYILFWRFFPRFHRFTSLCDFPCYPFSFLFGTI